MTPQEINSRLKELGISQASVAKRLGISRAAAYYLVNRRMVSKRCETGLARILGVSLKQFRAEDHEVAGEHAFDHSAERGRA